MWNVIYIRQSGRDQYIFLTGNGQAARADVELTLNVNMIECNKIYCINEKKISEVIRTKYFVK